MARRRKAQVAVKTAVVPPSVYSLRPASLQIYVYVSEKGHHNPTWPWAGYRVLTLFMANGRVAQVQDPTSPNQVVMPIEKLRLLRVMHYDWRIHPDTGRLEVSARLSNGQSEDQRVWIPFCPWRDHDPSVRVGRARPEPVQVRQPEPVPLPAMGKGRRRQRRVKVEAPEEPVDLSDSFDF